MAPSILTPSFRQVVADVAQRAKTILPQAVNGRVESAVKLVLAHDVTFLENGTIEVGSASDPLKVHVLTGATSDCADFPRAPESWCKHRLAAGIMKRVQQELARSTPEEAETEVILPAEMEVWSDNDPEPEETPMPSPTPAAVPCPEALFSLTLKGHIDGHEALLTARGMTAAEFTANLAAIRGLLDPRPQPQTQAPPPPAVQGQGQDVHWCRAHQVQMIENQKNGQRWYSHRLPEGGFCKGR